MRLTFFGGVGEVSGANYLLESGGTKIIVDCGLHQGNVFSEKHNWEPFPYDPREISAVLVTHAHIDHTGLLPRLLRDGFEGKIYSTGPTRDFAELLLLDSEHILFQEAERYGKPALYGVRDVEEMMARWNAVPYHQEINTGPFKIIFYNAAHILGSSFIVIEADDKKIVFSGDLGNSPAPLLGSLEIFEDADYCVIESAYGDRIHQEIKDGLVEDVIEDTVKAGGTLMIPAFAMERTQKLLFDINELMENGRVPKIPVFLDSPLAIKMTAVYKKHQSFMDKETLKLLKGDELLFDFPQLRKTLIVEQSKAINDVPPPKVIIAGSGMSQGGRILHHEKRYLSDSHSTILFVGYQAKNSLGRKIQDGAKIVKIHGEDVPVRCRVAVVEYYSAHADQPQLLDWLRIMRLSLQKVFVVQGEEGLAPLAHKIIDELAIKAEIPKEGDSFIL